jgi:hypothetical protein
MKNAVEMFSGAMIYVHTKLHKDWISQSKGKIHRQHDDHISLLSFFQNEGSRLRNSIPVQIFSFLGAFATLQLTY